MKFKVLAKSGEEKIIDFVPKHIINAGYTGRDQAAVQAHIDELKEEGIPAPDKTPVYFVKFIDKITQSGGFEVLDETDHSGEAEFALFFDKDEIYVGVGSDHTDRKLETVDIPKAKQIYPNTISKELWKLSDVIDHWDDITLRSWIKVDGERKLFQEAKLTAMLDAADLVERAKNSFVIRMTQRGWSSIQEPSHPFLKRTTALILRLSLRIRSLAAGWATSMR